jgi:hypothetical protein
LAKPLTYDSFIHYNLPVYPGAQGERTMKSMIAIRSAAGLVLLTAVFCGFFQNSAVAQTEYSPERLLVGKWRQQYGPYVTESVFTANGRFTSVTYDQFTRFDSWGRWEVKNGLLVSYFEDWWPKFDRFLQTYNHFVVVRRRVDTTNPWVQPRSGCFVEGCIHQLRW